MLYHQDGLRPGLPFSQINFKVRHLVFQSIFLLVESVVVRYSYKQPHLDKVVILQTTQTSVVCPLCCPIYLGSLNTVHMCVTSTMPIARQCKALCTKQADHANCKLHSAHPTPVNCGQFTKMASSLARVIIASESA